MAKDIKKKENTQTKKNVKVKAKEKKNNEKFLTGIRKEMKVVKWPSFKEIVKYTLATVVFCLILVAFFEILNVIMAYVKGLFN